jgi:hypothetical protein
MSCTPPTITTLHLLSTKMSSIEIHAQVAKMEKELAKLKAMLGMAVVPAKRAKRVVDPDAPKKAPTAWSLLLSRIRPVLKALSESDPMAKGVPVVMSVGKLVKDAGKQDSVTDDDIIEAFESWKLNPINPDTAVRKAAKGAVKAQRTSAASSVAEVESDDDSVEEDEVIEAPAPKKLVVKLPKPEAAVPKPEVAAPKPEAPKPKAKPAVVAKAEVEEVAKPKKAKKVVAAVPVVTPVAATKSKRNPELEFDLTVAIDEVVFIHNRRGDMVDENCLFVGHWDGTTLDRTAEEPDDIGPYLT